MSISGLPSRVACGSFRKQRCLILGSLAINQRDFGGDRKEGKHHEHQQAFISGGTGHKIKQNESISAFSRQIGNGHQETASLHVAKAPGSHMF